jgi:tRNA1Val (adenine37-N6)-methyltransferase
VRDGSDKGKDRSLRGANGRVDEDALFEGRLKLYQPARGFGYRTNVDALLLAAFACRGKRAARLVVDLGAGVGALGLSLLHFRAARRVEFIEKDALAAELCARNLAANGWHEVGAVIVGDLADSLEKLAPRLLHRADLVVANPPYFDDEAPHRSSKVAVSSPARRGRLAPFLRAAIDAMGRRARFCLVYPATELLGTMAKARELGLVAKRLRFVHGRPNRPARVALVELVFAKDGGLVVEPAMVEFDAENRAAPELAWLLSGDFTPAAPVRRD